MIELVDTSIHIDARQDIVFDLFTTEVGLCSWMAKEAAVDLRPGGRWLWVHDNDVAASGEYVEVDPHERVTFTYGWESGTFANIVPGSTHVEVTFTATTTGTTVRVAHSTIPVVHRDAHVGGWTYFLRRLADAATGRPTPGARLPPDATSTDDHDDGAT